MSGCVRGSGSVFRFWPEKKTVGSFLCAGYPLTRFGAGKERENLFHSRGQAPVSLVGAK